MIDVYTKVKVTFLIVFLLISTVLTIVIQFIDGLELQLIQYCSIILCFLASFVFIKHNRFGFLVSLALFFTVGADTFLVMCNPIQQVLGMMFFCLVQLTYCVFIILRCSDKKTNLAHIIVRVLLSIIIAVVTCLVLKQKTDALSIISMEYFVNLILNFVFTVICFKQNRILSIAFILFMCCDTIIGLTMANGVYFDIVSSQLLNMLLTGKTAWLFYLPAQALIVASLFKRDKVRSEEK